MATPNGDPREPEFDEPQDGTERANILLEELGGLPEDNPFTEVVEDLRDEGESFYDIYSTMEKTFDLLDRAAAEERNTLMPDWKVAAVVHDEHSTSGERYEYFERGAETANEAEQMVRDLGHRVDESKTEQVGVSKVF